MNTVHAIVIDKKRRLYVSDRANHRIQIFDENGKFLEAWPNVPLPYSLLMTDDQYFWSASGQTQKFTKYDLNGRLLVVVGHVRDMPGRVLGRAPVPRGQREQPLYRGRARRAAAEVPSEARRRRFSADRGADACGRVARQLVRFLRGTRRFCRVCPFLVSQSFALSSGSSIESGSGSSIPALTSRSKSVVYNAGYRL